MSTLFLGRRIEKISTEKAIDGSDGKRLFWLNIFDDL